MKEYYLPHILFTAIMFSLFYSFLNRCWSWRLEASFSLLTNISDMLWHGLLKPEASLTQCGNPL